MSKRSKMFGFAFLIIGLIPMSVFAQTYGDSEARGVLRDVGVEVNKSYPGTSLEGIRHKTLTEIIDLRQAYGRTITVTGGTESGHESGTYSHENGYKIDLRLESGLNSFIRSNFTEIPAGSKYSEKYRSPSGAEYGLEGDHWDVLVR
jgi:hypothetical protein